MLWLELPQGFDDQRLNRALLPHKIQIAPGSIFSAAANTAIACASTTPANPPQHLNRRFARSANAWPRCSPSNSSCTTAQRVRSRLDGRNLAECTPLKRQPDKQHRANRHQDRQRMTG